MMDGEWVDKHPSAFACQLEQFCLPGWPCRKEASNPNSNCVVNTLFIDLISFSVSLLHFLQMFPGITSKLPTFTQILVSEFMGGLIKTPNINVLLRAKEYGPLLAQYPNYNIIMYILKTYKIDTIYDNIIYIS